MAEAQPFLSTEMTVQRQEKILHVRANDEISRAVVAEQRAAHAVVHVASRAATDGDEVEDERVVSRYLRFPNFAHTSIHSRTIPAEDD